jgi:hypothetical protein
MQEVALICEDVRRKLNVLFAFIRQSVRESVLGFCPTSGGYVGRPAHTHPTG